MAESVSTTVAGPTAHIVIAKYSYENSQVCSSDQNEHHVSRWSCSNTRIQSEEHQKHPPVSHSFSFLASLYLYKQKYLHLYKDRKVLRMGMNSRWCLWLVQCNIAPKARITRDSYIMKILSLLPLHARYSWTFIHTVYKCVYQRRKTGRLPPLTPNQSWQMLGPP